MPIILLLLTYTLGRTLGVSLVLSPLRDPIVYSPLTFLRTICPIVSYTYSIISVYIQPTFILPYRLLLVSTILILFTNISISSLCFRFRLI